MKAIALSSPFPEPNISNLQNKHGANMFVTRFHNFPVGAEIPEGGARGK